MQFFKNRNHEERTLSIYVKEACDTVRIKEYGSSDYMTGNGRNATAISMLFEAGFQKEVVSTKFGK